MITEQMDFNDLGGILSSLREGAILKIVIRNSDNTPGDVMNAVVANASSDTGTIYFNPFNSDGRAYLINIRDVYAMGVIE